MLFGLDDWLTTAKRKGDCDQASNRSELTRAPIANKATCRQALPPAVCVEELKHTQLTSVVCLKNKKREKRRHNR